MVTCCCRPACEEDREAGAEPQLTQRTTIMPITVNLRHLEDQGLHLTGELTPEELEFGNEDELIQTNEPLFYDLEVEQTGPNLLVQGKLRF